MTVHRSKCPFVGLYKSAIRQHNAQPANIPFHVVAAADLPLLTRADYNQSVVAIGRMRA